MRKIAIYFALSFLVIITACSNDNNENGVPAIVIGDLNLAAPLDNSTCEGVSTSSTKCEVTLNWEPTSDNETYVLRLTNLNTNKVVLIQNDIKTTSYKIVLEKQVPFSWTVSSRDGVSKQISNISPIWKFYASAGESVANYAPFPATLLAPIQDKIVTAVDGKITATQATVSVSSGVYYWRVKSSDSNSSSFSQVVSFTVN